jgi:tetratricopeptide (TPR) repeat protein
MAFRIYMLITFAVAATGCSTTYKINSVPEGATVYHKSGSEPALLGTTPMEFKKSGLPEDGPFVLSFDRPGYERQDVAVTPTDNALTMINVNLKPSAANPNDPGLVRARKVVSAVFRIQELASAKKYLDALASIRELEQSEPDFAEILALKGSLYFVVGDKVQAKESWERALKLDPGLDSVRVRLGQLGGAP